MKYASSVAEAFRKVVSLYPSNIAIEYGKKISYSELDLSSNQAMRFLNNYGIKTGSKVGLFLSDPLTFIEFVVALVKMGAVYIPFDKKLPDKRIQLMLEISAAEFFVTDEPGVIGGGDHCRGIDARLNINSGESSVEELQNTSIGNDLPLYMMFTSGSTGMPKGIVIPHRGVLRLVCNPDYVSLGCTDVFLQLSSRSFDASTFEIWGALLNGGKLVLLPPDTELGEIVKMIHDFHVSVLFLTTRFFDLLVEKNIAALAGVSQLLFGGEIASMYHVQKAFTGLPHSRIIHVYGPTENTTFSTFHRVDEADFTRKFISIGYPVSGTRIFVLNEEALSPVNDGERGILFLAGEGLALGYTDDTLTKKRFTEHPATKERLYNSGDIVIHHSNTGLEFIGRNDRQVKIMGHRIELFEIESHLLHYPGISTVLVIFSKVQEKPLLIAFYNTYDGNRINVKNLQDYLTGMLPKAAVPAFFEFVQSFPLTSNGKIDRDVLFHGFMNKGILSPDKLNTSGESLLEIWRLLLSKHEINDHTNFFEEGGDSLSALKLTYEVQEKFNISLSSDYLIKWPTFKKFSDNLFNQDRNSILVCLRKGDDQSPLFCIPFKDGTPYTYIHLASNLRSKSAIYSFSFTDIDSNPFKYGSIEELAGFFCAEIIRMEKFHTIQLCGLSFGGIIAWEMAIQLKRAGIHATILHLFDSPEPDNYIWGHKPPLIYKFWLPVKEAINSRDFRLLCEQALAAFKNRIAYRNKTKNPVEKMNIFKNAAPDEVFLCKNYKTLPNHEIKIVLYRTRAFEYWKKTKFYGWEKYCKDIEYFDFTGGHTDLLRPPRVGRLAELMQKWL